MFARRCVIVLSVWLAAILPALAQPLTEEQRAALIERTTRVVEDSAFATGVDFAQWDTILEKHKGALDGAVDGQALVNILNAAMREFGISHLSVLTPRAAENRRSTDIVGIGIGAAIVQQGIVVERVVAGSPAERAGLAEGDIITAVDGERPKVTSVLRGDEGSVVRLDVVRGSDDAETGEQKHFEITRAKFSTRQPETLTWVRSDTAVLRIETFDTGYDRATVRSLFEQVAGAEALILDLRSNGGGEMRNFLHLLGFLLPTGTEVGTMVTRVTQEEYTRATGNAPTDIVAVARWSPRKIRVPRAPVPVFKGQLAVLINGGSASASEIVTMALREHADASVIGRASAGAVLVARYEELADGFEVKVPFSEFITSGGVRLEDNPIQVDVRVPARGGGRRERGGGGVAPGGASTDAGIAAALDRLSAMATSDETDRDHPFDEE